MLRFIAVLFLSLKGSGKFSNSPDCRGNPFFLANALLTVLEVKKKIATESGNCLSRKCPTTRFKFKKAPILLSAFNFIFFCLIFFLQD